MNKKKKSTNTSPYPDEVIDRLARAFYPAILACWNSEEGQRSLVGARPLHLANARPFGRSKAPLGLLLLRKRGILLSEETKNPNPSPIEKRFGFSWFGAMEGTRTPGLLIRSQSLYPAELPTHTFRSEHDVFYHSDWVLSTVFCKYFYLFQKAAFFMIFLVSFLSFLCYNSLTICF